MPQMPPPMPMFLQDARMQQEQMMMMPYGFGGMPQSPQDMYLNALRSKQNRNYPRFTGYNTNIFGKIMPSIDPAIDPFIQMLGGKFLNPMLTNMLEEQGYTPDMPGGSFDLLTFQAQNRKSGLATNYFNEIQEADKNRMRYAARQFVKMNAGDALDESMMEGETERMMGLMNSFLPFVGGNGAILGKTAMTPFAYALSDLFLSERNPLGEGKMPTAEQLSSVTKKLSDKINPNGVYDKKFARGFSAGDIGEMLSTLAYSGTGPKLGNEEDFVDDVVKSLNLGDATLQQRLKTFNEQRKEQGKERLSLEELLDKDISTIAIEDQADVLSFRKGTKNKDLINKSVGKTIDRATQDIVSEDYIEKTKPFINAASAMRNLMGEETPMADLMDALNIMVGGNMSEFEPQKLEEIARNAKITADRLGMTGDAMKEYLLAAATAVKPEFAGIATQSALQSFNMLKTVQNITGNKLGADASVVQDSIKNRLQAGFTSSVGKRHAMLLDNLDYFKNVGDIKDPEIKEAIGLINSGQESSPRFLELLQTPGFESKLAAAIGEKGGSTSAIQLINTMTDEKAAKIHEQRGPEGAMLMNVTQINDVRKKMSEKLKSDLQADVSSGSTFGENIKGKEEAIIKALQSGGTREEQEKALQAVLNIKDPEQKAAAIKSIIDKYEAAAQPYMQSFNNIQTLTATTSDKALVETEANAVKQKAQAIMQGTLEEAGFVTDSNPLINDIIQTFLSGGSLSEVIAKRVDIGDKSSLAGFMQTYNKVATPLMQELIKAVESKDNNKIQAATQNLATFAKVARFAQAQQAPVAETQAKSQTSKAEGELSQLSLTGDDANKEKQLNEFKASIKKQLSFSEDYFKDLEKFDPKKSKEIKAKVDEITKEVEGLTITSFTDEKRKNIQTKFTDLTKLMDINRRELILSGKDEKAKAAYYVGDILSGDEGAVNTAITSLKAMSDDVVDAETKKALTAASGMDNPEQKKTAAREALAKANLIVGDEAKAEIDTQKKTEIISRNAETRTYFENLVGKEQGAAINLDKVLDDGITAETEEEDKAAIKERNEDKLREYLGRLGLPADEIEKTIKQLKSTTTGEANDAAALIREKVDDLNTTSTASTAPEEGKPIQVTTAKPKAAATPAAATPAAAAPAPATPASDVQYASTTASAVVDAIKAGYSRVVNFFITSENNPNTYTKLTGKEETGALIS